MSSVTARCIDVMTSRLYMRTCLRNMEMAFASSIAAYGAMSIMCESKSLLLLLLLWLFEDDEFDPKPVQLLPLPTSPHVVSSWGTRQVRRVPTTPAAPPPLMERLAGYGGVHKAHSSGGV